MTELPVRIRFVRPVEPAPELARDITADRLIVRIQSGEREAMGGLYELYFRWVYAYLLMLVRDPHEAEDVAQDAFVRIYGAIPTYEHRGKPFRAWMFTVVRNLALNHIERQGRLSVEDPTAIGRRLEANGIDGDGDGFQTLGWITDSDLLLFIERLPISQRQVLLLRFMLDLPDSQIATILGRSAGEVRVLQHRALAFLRTRLSAIGRGPEPGSRAPMQRCRNKPPVARARRWALLGS